MSGAVLKSVLESVVNQYAGKSFKKQSVVNALKNRGVKDAELKDSGVLNFIDQAKTDKVQIDDLAEILKNRKDRIKIKRSEDTKYRSISTYQENTFAHTPFPAYYEDIYLRKVPKAEQVKNHFAHVKGAKNYYGHTRSFVSTSAIIDKHFKSVFGIGPEDIKKNPLSSSNHVELVVEIQSDKHSPGTKELFSHTLAPAGIQPIHSTRNMVKNKLDFSFRKNINRENTNAFILFERNILKQATDIDAPEFTTNDLKQMLSKSKFSDEIKQIYIRREKSIVSLINKRRIAHKKWEAKFELHRQKANANFEKDPKYIQNIINNKLVNSYNKDMHIVIFRIGNDKKLKRSEGAQKLYDTVIAPSLRKTANKIGAKIFENKTYISLILPTAGFILPVYAEDTNKLNVIGTKNLMRQDNGR